MTLFAGRSSIDDLTVKPSYGNWSSYFKHAESLEIGKVMQALTMTQLTEAELSAYEAPFPDSRYYACPRRMPQIVAAHTANPMLRLQRHHIFCRKIKVWKLPIGYYSG